MNGWLFLVQVTSPALPKLKEALGPFVDFLKYEHAYVNFFFELLARTFNVSNLATAHVGAPENITVSWEKDLGSDPNKRFIFVPPDKVEGFKKFCDELGLILTEAFPTTIDLEPDSVDFVPNTTE